ncbi:MAG: ATP-binding cassette domain-containing protein [Hyphomonadaceae bacterium]|nr:ATP-binding cassette domain-containing protein [Hyphomonadaceae bacterium]
MPRSNSPELDLFERGVLVRLTQVDAGYRSGDVLRGIEFEVNRSEVALVTGPAAAGKTTLIHLLRLALQPTAGRAVILGADARRLNMTWRARLKRHIGYVAENPSFIENWSAYENIALPLKLMGRKPAEYAPDVQELVEFVGLNADAGTLASQLSGAQRRRAAIARALAGKPDLILADDPTAGMSPADGKRIVRLLAEMRRVGAAIVITSQDQGLAEVAPTTSWRLERGRLTPVSAVEDAEDYEAT